MSRRLNPRVYLVKESPTRAIDRIRLKLKAENKDIIMLSAGQPSIPPPSWAIEEFAAEIKKRTMSTFGYTPTRGLPDVISAILLELSANGLNLSEKEVALTGGGQNALFSVLSTILEPGDPVAVLDPLYFGYWPLLDYLDLRPIRIPTLMENGFQPDTARIEAALASGARAVILVTPDNPTGRLLSEKTLREITELAIDYEAWLVVDEAYRSLVYEGEHVYAYKLAPDRTIAVNTLSKDPGMPGWRLGFVYGPEEVISRIVMVVQETIYCPPLPAQLLAKIYYSNRKGRKEHLNYIVRTYRARRDSLMRALKEYVPESKFHTPEGGMFLFADFSSLLPEKITSDELAVKLLQSKGVATVPGSFFSTRYTKALRLSFVSETPERLEEAARRISEALDELQRK